MVEYTSGTAMVSLVGVFVCVRAVSGGRSQEEVMRESYMYSSNDVLISGNPHEDCKPCDGGDCGFGSSSAHQPFVLSSVGLVVSSSFCLQ